MKKANIRSRRPHASAPSSCRLRFCAIRFLIRIRPSFHPIPHRTAARALPPPPSRSTTIASTSATSAPTLLQSSTPSMPPRSIGLRVLPLPAEPPIHWTAPPPPCGASAYRPPLHSRGSTSPPSYRTRSRNRRPPVTQIDGPPRQHSAAAALAQAPNPTPEHVLLQVRRAHLTIYMRT